MVIKYVNGWQTFKETVCDKTENISLNIDIYWNNMPNHAGIQYVIPFLKLIFKFPSEAPSNTPPPHLSHPSYINIKSIQGGDELEALPWSVHLPGKVCKNLFPMTPPVCRLVCRSVGLS